MSVLTHDELLKQITAGNIRIDPFDASCVGPASIDLHLDNQFRIFLPQSKAYEVTDTVTYEEITRLLPPTDAMTLEPNQTIHGITKETVTLADDLCGWLEGRSSLGRLGITVHITASFIQPGVSNKQVLEIHNVSPVSLILHSGLAVCQIVIEQTIGSASYQGRYRTQTTP